MKIELFINEKEPEIDVDLNEQEMECSPFSFALEQLSQYVNGEIIIYFDELHKINIDLFYDFSVCLDDILKSIKNVRSNLPVNGSIWFCEQGYDFYIDYKNKNGFVEIYYRKGVDTGFPNSGVEDFSAIIQASEYVSEWSSVIDKINGKIFKYTLRDISNMI